MDNGKNWREQLAAVEARLQRYEADAQKKIQEVAQRGAASRKELEEMVAKVKSGELLVHAAELRSRAEQTGTQVLKRFEGMQERAFERMGIATRPQIAELGAQVSRLSRKLEKISRQARHWATDERREAPERPAKETPNA